MVINKKPHVSIIILNWNTWQDTIECLESVLKNSYKNFNIILIDNGSENSSVEKIKNWVFGYENINITTKFKNIVYPFEVKPIDFYEVEIENYHAIESIDIKNKSIVFIKSNQNLGFAIGNNRGMDIAKDLFKSGYYFLLNNDTVVENSFLSELILVLESNKDISAAQSTIFYYDNPNSIANAGGKIVFWGQRKYYNKIKKDEIKRISYINGCALLLRYDTVEKYGKLTEKFFFAEEDFNYSLRMNKNKLTMVSVANSKVYHKIGSTSSKYVNIKRKIFLSGLNRLVDLKYHYNSILWYLWRELMLFYYIALMLLKYKLKLFESCKLVYYLRCYSSRVNDVRRRTINKIFSTIKI